MSLFNLVQTSSNFRIERPWSWTSIWIWSSSPTRKIPLVVNFNCEKNLDQFKIWRPSGCTWTEIFLIFQHDFDKNNKIQTFVIMFKKQNKIGTVFYFFLIFVLKPRSILKCIYRIGLQKGHISGSRAIKSNLDSDIFNLSK